MPIALVSSVTRAGAGTSASIDTTGATLLVVVTSTGNFSGDSKGNTYTKLTARTGTFGSETSIWYAENPTVGSGHTFTVTGVTGLVAAAFSGAEVSSVFDQENGTASGSPAQPGSITPGDDNELIITGLGGGSVGDGSADSGFSLVADVGTTGGVNFSAGMAYKVQTTAAAVNPTWTWSEVYGSAGLVIASFKAAAGGNIDADVPAGLIDFTGVAMTAAKSAAVPIGLAELLGVAPTAAMSAALSAVGIDLVGVAPTAKHSAAVAVVQIDLVGIDLESSSSAAVSAVQIDLTGIALTAAKSAAVPAGRCEFVGVDLESNSSASVPAVSWELVGLAATAAKAAGVPAGLLKFVGIAATIAGEVQSAPAATCTLRRRGLTLTLRRRGLTSTLARSV